MNLYKEYCAKTGSFSKFYSFQSLSDLETVLNKNKQSLIYLNYFLTQAEHLVSTQRYSQIKIQ